MQFNAKTWISYSLSLIWLSLKAFYSTALPDLFVFGGLAALGYGIWTMNEGAAFIVVGAIVFLLGFFASIEMFRKGGR